MDQIVQDADLETEIPAISIQFTTAIGGTRNLTLTTGVPLDGSPGVINEILDKIVTAADRQRRRFDLEQTKASLRNEEQNLHLHRQQLAAQELRFETEHAASGRHGSWSPKGGQKGVMDGLNKNIANSVDRIKQLRELIEEIAKECR